jgi:hypothetical protein
MNRLKKLPGTNRSITAKIQDTARLEFWDELSEPRGFLSE